MIKLFSPLILIILLIIVITIIINMSPPGDIDTTVKFITCLQLSCYRIISPAPGFKLLLLDFFCLIWIVTSTRRSLRYSVIIVVTIGLAIADADAIFGTIWTHNLL